MGQGGQTLPPDFGWQAVGLRCIIKERRLPSYLESLRVGLRLDWGQGVKLSVLA